MHEEIKDLRHQQKVLLKFAQGNTRLSSSTRQFDHLSSMTAVGQVDDMRSSWSPSIG